MLSTLYFIIVSTDYPHTQMSSCHVHNLANVILHSAWCQTLVKHVIGFYMAKTERGPDLAQQSEVNCRVRLTASGSL